MGPLGHSLAALVAVGAAPVGAAALALRPPWRAGLWERLGAAPRVAPGALWVHAASVGEVRAALPLLALAESRGHRIVASATTVTGRAALRRARPGAPATLSPLDHPWAVARALGRAGPSALVLVETELWPCWIRAAGERRIPVVVVSGRISDRSFPRYRRLLPLLASTVRRLAGVGARSEEDAARFAALGVPRERLRVTGDLKLAATEPAALAPDLGELLGAVPLFVAGSTHEGEEEAALDALAAAERAGSSAALVLAPRRPERAASVVATAEKRGRRVRRRSDAGPGALAPGEVLVLDGLGELGAVYTRASVAFVGGTLVPVGGHNLLEPVQAGAPVLFGPSTESGRESAALLAGSGAGLRVEDAAALAAAVTRVLRDPAGARARGAAGRALLATHGDGAARSLDFLEETLARTGGGG